MRTLVDALVDQLEECVRLICQIEAWRGTDAEMIIDGCKMPLEALRLQIKRAIGANDAAECMRVHTVATQILEGSATTVSEMDALYAPTTKAADRANDFRRALERIATHPCPNAASDDPCDASDHRGACPSCLAARALAESAP